MAFRIKCKCCGKEFLAKSEYRRYCNADCYDRHHKVESAPIPKSLACRFADGVVCEKRSCEACGWNPAVAKERLAKFHEKMEAIYG